MSCTPTAIFLISLHALLFCLGVAFCYNNMLHWQIQPDRKELVIVMKKNTETNGHIYYSEVG